MTVTYPASYIGLDFIRLTTFTYRSRVGKMESCSDGRFLLLFGSQLGQAQAIAEMIRDVSITKGLRPVLHCLDQTEKEV